jgi:dephospho-CoA kinase
MEAKLPNPNKKIVFGITGELLSGKTTAADFFIKEFNAERFKFSGLLDEVLKILDLPLTRINEQDMGALLKKEFGEDVLVNTLAKRASLTDRQFILFDGLRKPEEVQAIKTQIPGFKLIYIQSQLETRYARLKDRREKPDEHTKTFEEFIESQKHSADASIPLLVKDADFVIHNDSTIESFLSQLRNIVEKESV